MMKFLIDYKSIEDGVILFYKSHSMSDRTLSDIDFKNKVAWVWTSLNSGINQLTSVETLKSVQ